MPVCGDRIHDQIIDDHDQIIDHSRSNHPLPAPLPPGINIDRCLSKGRVNNDVRLPRGDWIKNCVCVRL
jgi:hypothetical protein